MPDLSGKLESDLESYLEAAGFKLGSVSEKASDEPEGTVIGQDPKPGTEAEKGTAINVTVSDGSKAKAIMPFVTGMPLNDASNAIYNAGLSVGNISYDYSNTYASGEVMWQQYEGNAQKEKGTSVKLIVSKGKKPEETAAPAPAPEDEE